MVGYPLDVPIMNYKFKENCLVYGFALSIFTLLEQEASNGKQEPQTCRFTIVVSDKEGGLKRRGASPPWLSHICSGLLPMLYRMDKKPD